MTKREAKQTEAAFLRSSNAIRRQYAIAYRDIVAKFDARRELYFDEEVALWQCAQTYMNSLSEFDKHRDLKTHAAQDFEVYMLDYASAIVLFTKFEITDYESIPRLPDSFRKGLCPEVAKRALELMRQEEETDVSS